MALIDGLHWVRDAYTWDLNYHRGYRRIYRAYFNITNDAYYVRTHVGVSPLSRHPEDAGCLVINISGEMESPEQMSHPGTQVACFSWLITIEYGYVSPLEVTATGNPLAKPVVFTWEPEETTEIVTVDVNLDASGRGTPILNSAGIPYDPPVERLTGKGLLTVYRNEAANFNYVTASGYCDFRVNDSIWNGFAAKTILAKPFRLPQIEYSQEANVWFYPMQYQFHYEPRTWQKKILDAGYEEIDPADATKRKLILVSGQPVSTAQLLDGAGHWVDHNPTAAQVTYFTYDIYQAIDFTVFNLDTLFTLPTL
jgi:hypothetical protein